MGRYLLVSIVADVKCVAVFVHLLRPAARRGAVLTVRLARVGAEAGVLRRQRLEVADGERQVGDDRRRERERCGLTAMKKERGRKREGGGTFTRGSEDRRAARNHQNPSEEPPTFKLIRVWSRTSKTPVTDVCL